MTAAHCVGWGLGALNTTLHLGDHSLTDEEPGEMTRKVRRIMMHKSYNARNTDYDIAVIEMDRPVEYSDNVRPVCLPEKDMEFTGKVTYLDYVTQPCDVGQMAN